MKCLNCGHDNRLDARYCSDCGFPLYVDDSEGSELIEPQNVVSEIEKVQYDQSNEIIDQSRMSLYHSQDEERETVKVEDSKKDDDFQQSKRTDHSTSILSKWLTWKNIFGFSLILLSLISLLMVYRLNYSKEAVEEQFTKGIKNGDYLKAAAVVKTPLTKEPWSDLDIKRTIDHYQEAEIDFRTLLEEGDLSEGLKWQGIEIAKVERSGSFLLIFPKYVVDLHALPVQMSLSNEYRDLKILGEQQVEQTINSNEGIYIEPRIQSIMVQYSHQGKKEEVWLDLDYHQLKDLRHQLSLVPVTNDLIVDEALLGIRPDLPFEVVSFNIDGQDYSQKRIKLSGFAGQIFDVSFKAIYNGQLITTEKIPVKLINNTKVSLDYSNDQTVKAQIQQAELQ
ncbi:zinc-ribbon domain-containing protein [Facklamia miroungae]|uniref:Uncharacterized membrane protein YvbJ n=1 Tax=Facklamia miroungae TaxID=120956 RepID=A0A1G7SKB6_9LACT|nr:zinc ribbon domain-containing protein [Facklamia miroungae]NKZ29622.1 zinc ribbon domain-containing protein [Facklamia miroungae]SDG23401.1 Uncharacterized membrane protein YvbJ [Facklamia miroungae]